MSQKSLHAFSLRSVFVVVEPSKDDVPYRKCYTQKEDTILLHIGYHRIPKQNATHLLQGLRQVFQCRMRERVPGLLSLA